MSMLNAKGTYLRSRRKIPILGKTIIKKESKRLKKIIYAGRYLEEREVSKEDRRGLIEEIYSPSMFKLNGVLVLKTHWSSPTLYDS